ncbi:hypothetical protein EIJ57_09335 [Xanthomonas perforans]|nr:hypothetical protein EIJ57_09335 [Xanthomonas perforans]TVS57723.1 hypothetical protein E2P66_02750 [Xanthomonas perforans]TVS59030.1 hypothetical protein E2P69_02520 [Xanthomonas perforans]
MPCPRQPITPRLHILVQARSALAQQRFQKSASFPLFFLCRAFACLPGRLDGTAVKPMRWHCLPPVRQLKIFYPTAALPASHEQKCANLLSA